MPRAAAHPATRLVATALALLLAAAWALLAVLPAEAKPVVPEENTTRTANDAPADTDTPEPDDEREVSVSASYSGRVVTVNATVRYHAVLGIGEVSAELTEAPGAPNEGRRQTKSASGDGKTSFTWTVPVDCTNRDAQIAVDADRSVNQGRTTVSMNPVPAQPSHVQAEAAGKDVKVSWSGDADEYVVTRAGGGFSTTTGSTSVTDAVGKSGEFSYTVTAKRNGCQSQPASSNTVRIADASEADTTDTADDASGSRSSGQVRTNVRRPPQPRSRPSQRSESGGSGDAPLTAPRDHDPDHFEGTLDFGDLPENGDDPQVAAEDEDIPEPGEPEAQSALEVSEREFVPERVLVPLAAGLLFTLGALHVRRFLSLSD